MLLPSDPENMNDERAQWAKTALDAFRKVTRTDPADAIADLIADVAHYCDRHRLSLSNELRRAAEHYREETNRKGTQLRHGMEIA